MKRKTLNCNGKPVFIDKPVVMGILNVTPDSFYDGGIYRSEKEQLKRCEAIIREGGRIIDIGAASSRPGASAVGAEEELRRLKSTLVPVRKQFPDVLISVDTFRADIARTVVQDYGVDIINDISAGGFDADMFETVARLNVPYIMMHMQGTPETMQQNPVYDNLMVDLIRYFSERIHRLRGLGVKDIMVDPGFGFGKTVEHNYEILRRLGDLEIFETPILAGVSRKSMIGHLLGVGSQHALNGTTAVNTLALVNGADILRVHDVKEAVECVEIVQAYRRADPFGQREES